MPIPKSRAELLDYVRSTFHKLKLELDAAGPQASDLHCVDDWRFRDLMAVRAWWTQSVVDWAGNYPLSRWISINTARQYTTARTYLRRALRESR